MSVLPSRLVLVMLLLQPRHLPRGDGDVHEFFNALNGSIEWTPSHVTYRVEIVGREPVCG
jgi:hypothetical protein